MPTRTHPMACIPMQAPHLANWREACSQNSGACRVPLLCQGTAPPPSRGHPQSSPQEPGFGIDSQVKLFGSEITRTSCPHVLAEAGINCLSVRQHVSRHRPLIHIPNPWVPTRCADDHQRQADAVQEEGSNEGLCAGRVQGSGLGHEGGGPAALVQGSWQDGGATHCSPPMQILPLGPSPLQSYLGAPRMPASRAHSVSLRYHC